MRGLKFMGCQGERPFVWWGGRGQSSFHRSFYVASVSCEQSNPCEKFVICDLVLYHLLFLSVL